MPDVTVVVATRLRPERLRFLTELHASLDAQDADWEAVLAIDGADPALLPTPLAADSRVRVLPLPRPVGAACARNLAVNLASGRALTWADDDDVLPPFSLSSRLHHLDNTGLGWVAGDSADLYDDGSLHLWKCSTPSGRHEPGAVWAYWPTPHHTIPLGPTTILARTHLWSAIGGMGGLVQGEDYLALRVTHLAAGELLPQVVYHYRKHPHQLTRQTQYDELEAAARNFAWRSGNDLALALGHRPHTGRKTAGGATL
ncbi:glycosyltransferase [Actinacidiphila sp. DG2A-62]|uniref:glycosyltransferase family 2 protein n=1 Tax=Actinacidiphila sp. DG2A-62 TaxID=3108821 RepID=UPI002DB999E9|nr:glycosyltransferase [Actinacidiphila sp. DG2A-62]MEC3997157.1 glycosyltransferase [Actinacidiphila sp. DG2A-62]